MAGLLLIGVMGACGGDEVEPEEPRPSSITIAPESATLTYITQTREFTATVWDQSRRKMIVWTLGPKRRQWVSVAGPGVLRNV